MKVLCKSFQVSRLPGARVTFPVCLKSALALLRRDVDLFAIQVGTTWTFSHWILMAVLPTRNLELSQAGGCLLGLGKVNYDPGSGQLILKPRLLYLKHI